MGKTYSQCQHERINGREYPGTRQLCDLCEQPTGRCEDDTLYLPDLGHLCEDCFEENGGFGEDD